MNPKHTKQNFIMNFRVFERMKWKEVAGQAGADIYEYSTYKNEILKAKRKTPNRNYYIPISNIGLEENGYGMHRETKSKAIRKLAYAGLIKWEKEIGGTFRIIKLI